MSAGVQLLQFRIERFRGFENLVWNPDSGMNLLIGGGDLGKSTILEAIALLFQPSNNVVLSEADYWQRDVGEEFVISAVISVPDELAGTQSRMAWPWLWDGSGAVVPELTDDKAEASGAGPGGQPVYRIRVRGSVDLDASWEVVQPNGEVDSLSVAFRRKAGVVSLSGGDRHDRDLRLVSGSALDRLLSDRSLRARLGQEIAGINLDEKLSERAKEALSGLDEKLGTAALPAGLKLGFTGGQGASVGALIGLMADNPRGVSLPYSSWGEGTRRLASLQAAAASSAETNISIVDEVERGLEPYRLRSLVRNLQMQPGQSFVTTHSAVAVNAADGASLWYMNSGQQLSRLPGEDVASLQEREPETFLSKFVVLAEGATEVGFVRYLLEKALGGRSLQDYGICVSDVQGNDSALKLLRAFEPAGLLVAGFVDYEGRSPERWKKLRESMQERLFQWPQGCTESEIISLLEAEQLRELIAHPDAGIDVERRLTLKARLGIESCEFDDLEAAADGGLMAVVIAAAIGNTDDAASVENRKLWKGHSRRWFKSQPGGAELAEKMFTLGLWPQLRSSLLPFINSVLGAVGLEEIADLG